jgi:hypothetical protein
MASVAAFGLWLTPVAGAADPALDVYIQSAPAEKRVPREYSEKELDSVDPGGPNPYLSLLPSEAETNWDYWRARARSEGRARTEGATGVSAVSALASFGVSETEPNDTQATANLLVGFGTGDDDSREADVSGSLDPVVPVAIGSFPEDDGSIPLARNMGLTAGSAVRADGAVGDGPFGSSGTGRGDFDFFRIPGVGAGQTIVVDVDTAIPFGPLDSFVVIYSSAGVVVAFNDDDGSSFDSFLAFRAPFADDYFISVGGFGSFSLSDPFDSSSGPGVGSEGAYEVTLGLDMGDLDFFSMELESGDILGGSASGSATRLQLLDPAGDLRVGSGQDLTFIHPGVSPLPGGGNAVFSSVIETAGTYAVRVSGSGTGGAYALALRVFTAALLDADEGDVQTVFVDFDGATVDQSAFGGAGLRTLSPLSNFLAGWGLAPSDEDAVIDAIVAELNESLSEDMRVKGNNGDFDASGRAGEFDIEIQNSRDHPDPAGLSHVSRVVVGGTIPELGIGTIGIAESIDPGNFATEEVAVVLLDLLSAPAPNANSLNTFPRDPGASIIDVIGAGVGNIVAHEAGHVFGNFHTEQFLTLPNIMDQGGNLANIVGVGPDGVFGTADDADVDFGPDMFVPNEGFTGQEDTLNTVAFGLPTPVFAIEVGFDVRPGNDENPVNPNAKGVVQVAILGSASFDVGDVDVSTLAFGPAAATAIGMPQIRDASGEDGFADLVVRVDLAETGLSDTAEELCFSGETLAATPIFGCDAIRAVPLACEFRQLGDGLFLPEGPPNGGFESGDFSGWSQQNAGSGGIVIDDGSFVPPGPGGAFAPFEGAFAAATFQSGPARHTLLTDVSLSSDLLGARLRWADNLQNHAGTFVDPIQEWRVEVWDPGNDSVLAELFSTDPGDPPIQDWTEREADLSPWIGQTIRLAFTQEDALFFFNARLDDVQVLGRRLSDIAIDIRPKNGQNVVNPASHGTVPVALLGSASFSVADVDALTLAFGPEGAPPVHAICDPDRLASHVLDVDADGNLDLRVHVSIPDSGIAFGDTIACVRGATLDGAEFEGCDTIRTVGREPSCGLGFEFVLLLPTLRALRRGRRDSGRTTG